MGRAEDAAHHPSRVCVGLLWAFCVTALGVSIGLGFIVLTIFLAKGAFMGTTST